MVAAEKQPPYLPAEEVVKLCEPFKRQHMSAVTEELQRVYSSKVEASEGETEVRVDMEDVLLGLRNALAIYEEKGFGGKAPLVKEMLAQFEGRTDINPLDILRAVGVSVKAPAPKRGGFFRGLGGR